ncbi:MAG: glycosyltransferase family 9 protein [Elusimicrobiota bacterium]
MPALAALRQGLPKARITFLANRHPGSEELIPNTGLVDEVWFDDSKLLRRILSASFDAVIASQATPFRPFVLKLLGIPIRIGHCRPLRAPNDGWSPLRYAFWRFKRAMISDEFERRWVFNKKVLVAEDLEHAVSRNLRLVEALGLPIPKASECRPALPVPETAVRFAKQLLPDTREKTIGLHIGSPQSQYAKIWPPEKWAEVCRLLSQSYRLRLALIGGPEEAGLVPRFKSCYREPFTDLVGKSNLLESFSLIQRCDLFLSNDTGMSKAAMALDVPTATVWGPSDRPGYGIVWNPSRHTEIFLPLPCSPCVRMGLRAEGSNVINFANCGHHACLETLPPRSVFEAVQKRYGGILQ